MKYTCVHFSDIIWMKVLGEALNQCIFEQIPKNQRPVRYLVKNQTTILHHFSLIYSQCSWIYYRLWKVLQYFFLQCFSLSLISISQVYLSRETTFICHNLGDVIREKHEELSFCCWKLFEANFLCTSSGVWPQVSSQAPSQPSLVTSYLYQW